MMRLATTFLGAFMLPLQAFAQNTPPAPLPVQVTFFSSGKSFLMLPGSRAAFVGKVFDEHRELALLGRHRFVTFNLAPGIHVLSSNWWLTTGPAGGTHLTIDLVPGIHYYISESLEEVGLGGTKIIMEEVTCEDAQQANVDTKPLAHKHIGRDGITTALAQATFPRCQ